MAIKIQGNIVIDDSQNVTVTGYGSFNGTSYVKLPAGTDAQRPSTPSAGTIRYNTTSNLFEMNDGTEWFSVTGSKSSGSIVMTKNTAAETYTFTSGLNGMSVGPVTVNNGVSITVGTGQRWVVL